MFLYDKEIGVEDMRIFPKMLIALVITSGTSLIVHGIHFDHGFDEKREPGAPGGFDSSESSTSGGHGGGNVFLYHGGYGGFGGYPVSVGSTSGSPGRASFSGATSSSAAHGSIACGGGRGAFIGAASAAS